MPRLPVALVAAVIAFLALTGAARAQVPANTTAPEVTGVAREGTTLTSTTGTWTGPGTIQYARRWQRCDPIGLECVNLSATGATYVPVAADVNATLRVVVTATNAYGPASATSAATAVVTGTPPQNTVAPSMTGNARAGQTLTAVNGTWTGTATISHSIQWRRCDSAGSACAPIAGATGATYRLGDDDVGRTVRIRVVASNPAGTGEATSVATPVVGPPSPPVNTIAPAVTGTLRDGTTISSTTGTWTGAPTITFTRRWQRCDSLGVACQETGVTGTNYALTPADLGHTMRVAVTAANPDGTASVTSSASGVVEPAPPANTRLPSVGGPMRVTHTLAASNASWTGTAPMSYTHAWRRCEANGTSCSPISGEAAATYVLRDADLGKTIRYEMTASNSAGSTTATSLATAVIGPRQPPVSSAPPVISGTARDGQTLNASTGSWSGVATIAYTRRWQRCNAEGAACEDTTGTGVQYPLSAADVGKTLRVVVTADNPDGTASATSAPTPVIAPTPPLATALPSITGVARDDAVLSASTGTWSGTSPVTLAYQWRRCEPSGAGCVDIPGATAANRRLTATDIGRSIRVVVTGTNAAGTTTATSSATQAVTLAPPVSTKPPSVPGTPRDGQPLAMDLGNWTGTASLSFARQWIRCNPGGGACSDIPGATGATYVPMVTDVGLTLRVRVTASNAGGTASSLSAASAVVTPAPPAPVAPPVLAGVERDGQILSAGPGTWTGSTPLTLSYRWERCDELASCLPVPGATQTTYRLTSADVGARIRVVAIASNPAGSASAESSLSAPIGAAPPLNVTPPAVAGMARDTQTLSADSGVWSGTVPMAPAYQWLRCDLQGDACVAIPGSTRLQHQLVPEDVAHTLRLQVTMTNVAGTTTARSLQSQVIAAEPPAIIRPPAVVGLARDGRTLTAEDGEWSGTRPLEVAYGWQRCNVTGAQCTDITGATSRTYVLTTEDMTFTVRVFVTITNAAGTATATSTPTGVVQPNPPVNVSPPTLSGEPRDGELLRAHDGTWNGVILIGFEYRWWRCNATGGDCGVIPGATASTYRLTPDDVAVRIKVEVIGRNAGGATSAFSEPAGITVHAPPAPLVLPSVTGHHGVGQLLEAAAGSWSGSRTISFQYTWLRCDAGGDGCSAVPNATSNTLRLTDADLGRRIRVRVDASNVAGSYSVTSAPSALVRDDPPVLAEPPTIEGTLIAQDVPLDAAPGRWTGAEPMAPAYEWRRCDATGAACKAIPGATAARYIPQAADVGFTLRVVVAMDNGVGSTTALSRPTIVVAPQPPRSTAAPTITSAGNRPGKDLTAVNGTWTGALPITYSYLWLRCDANGEQCVPIADATSQRYTLSALDVGRMVHVEVVAQNATARVSARSAGFGPVAAAPPAALTRPSVVVDGKPREGGQLRVDAGTWNGTEPLVLGYQWQRCVGAGDCRDIPGATSPEYTPGAVDIGRRIRVRVTATNPAGYAVADSIPTDAVAGSPPVVRDAPVITVEGGGPPTDGHKITLSGGSWDGTGPIELSYRWQRCDKGTCTDIKGEVGATYRLTTSDVGKRLVGVVTARSPAGKDEAASSQTEPVVPEAPRATLRPRILRPPGLLEAGAKLEVREARFAGTDPLTVTYQWLRCTKDRDRCRAIRGATTPTYELAKNDMARRGRLRRPLVVAMTAKNTAGAATSTSPVLTGSIATITRVALRGPVRLGSSRLVVDVACKGGRPQPCVGVISVVVGQQSGRVPVSVPAGKVVPLKLALTGPAPGAGARPSLARLRFRPAEETAGKAVVRKLRTAG